MQFPSSVASIYTRPSTHLLSAPTTLSHWKTRYWSNEKPLFYQQKLLKRLLEVYKEYVVSVRKQQQQTDDIKTLETEKENMKNIFQKTLQKVEHRIGMEFARKLEQAEAACREASQEDLRTQRSEHMRTLKEERVRSLSQLADIKGQLAALDQVFDCELEQRRRSHRVNKLLFSCLAVEEAIAACAPLGDKLRVLCQLGVEDEVISLIPPALPQSLDEPLPSPADLQAWFLDVVYDDCRRAAFVPSGWGLVGHAVANVFSSLYIMDTPATHSTGNQVTMRVRRNLERINAAWHSVNHGDILSAVSHLEVLDGLCGDVAQRWIAEARRAVVVAQAMRVVRARLQCLDMQNSVVFTSCGQ
eukprot:GHVS01009437.1.p1 GENE.GHVS01009437.1~~GHVS01009437.1.p1  ORF type:complete len:358 (+),score=73.85 GHVS01009437.1:495-1568(+)